MWKGGSRCNHCIKVWIRHFYPFYSGVQVFCLIIIIPGKYWQKTSLIWYETTKKYALKHFCAMCLLMQFHFLRSVINDSIDVSLFTKRRQGPNHYSATVRQGVYSAQARWCAPHHVGSSLCSVLSGDLKIWHLTSTHLKTDSVQCNGHWPSLIWSSVVLPWPQMFSAPSSVHLLFTSNCSTQWWW